MSDVRIIVEQPDFETTKAYGWRSAEGITWVPKSQCDLLDEVHAGSDRLILVVASWLDAKVDLEGQIGKGYA